MSRHLCGKSLLVPFVWKGTVSHTNVVGAFTVMDPRVVLAAGARWALLGLLGAGTAFAALVLTASAAAADSSDEASVVRPVTPSVPGLAIPAHVARATGSTRAAEVVAPQDVSRLELAQPGATPPAQLTSSGPDRRPAGDPLATPWEPIRTSTDATAGTVTRVEARATASVDAVAGSASRLTVVGHLTEATQLTDTVTKVVHAARTTPPALLGSARETTKAVLATADRTGKSALWARGETTAEAGDPAAERAVKPTSPFSTAPVTADRPLPEESGTPDHSAYPPVAVPVGLKAPAHEGDSSGSPSSRPDGPVAPCPAQPFQSGSSGAASHGAVTLTSLLLAAAGPVLAGQNTFLVQGSIAREPGFSPD